MANIQASVGRGGRNFRGDVTVVQRLLNQNHTPPDAILEPDGYVGPKTICAIEKYQRTALKVRRPDGRVDPGRRTIQTLTRGGHPQACDVTVAAPMRKHEHQLQRFFVDKKKSAWWKEFWGVVVADATPEVKRFFTVISRAEDARKVAEFYVRLREMGANAREIKQVLALIAGYKNQRWTSNFVAFLAEPTGPAGNVLGKLAKAGKFVGFVAFVVEYADHWSKGDYHMAVVEVYKTYMGDAVPWAGYVDTLQSFAGVVLPKSVQSDTAYKCIKAIDPIGLGAQGIDAIGVAITMAIEQKIDDGRLRRLAERMKTGSTAVFYDTGENLAKSLVKVADMSDREFDEMISASNIWAWIKDLA